MKLLKRWIKSVSKIRERRKIIDMIEVYESLVDNSMRENISRELTHYRIDEAYPKENRIALRYVGRYYTRKKFEKIDNSCSNFYSITFKPKKNERKIRFINSLGRARV